MKTFRFIESLVGLTLHSYMLYDAINYLVIKNKNCKFAMQNISA